MRRISILAGLCAVLLAGCGGSDTITGEASTSSSSSSGSGTTGTQKLSIGSGTGSAFQAGAIGISTTMLSAGGSTSLQVSIVDQTGALYTTATAVTFSSPCQAQGLAAINATGVTPASPTVTTSTGSASATYVASGCSGTDVITATATVNGSTLTATGSVTVAQAAIGSISFISATPANITLKGTGATSGGASTATSTVIFEVLDTSGGPRVGATVNFTLSTNVGGITLAPASAVSDAAGKVQTVVSSGTVATTVRVTATTTAGSGTTIATESSALTVSTGIPTSNNISLAVKCFNVEAYDYDGVVVPVTVAMTDRFSNPVPDGTTANFQTTLAGIQATCQTTGGTGTCSVNWVSKAPYAANGNPRTTAGNALANTADNWCPASGPATNYPYCNGTTNGRSPIVVTAIGEESFVDANGSGIFNSADTVGFDPSDADNNFASGLPKPWQDTSEPFLNEWELKDQYGTPTYVLGEPFIDFNNNGKRDGPDGLFEGALCEGPYCNANQSTVAIGTSNIIVASTSAANYELVLNGSNYTMIGGIPVFTLPTNISMYIFDQNFQQMPAGTTVTASFSANAGTLATPAYAAWPCDTTPPVFSGPVTYDSNGYHGIKSAGQPFSFFGTPPTSGAVPGTMFVTVTSPRGIVSTFTFAVSN